VPDFRFRHGGTGEARAPSASILRAPSYIPRPSNVWKKGREENAQKERVVFKPIKNHLILFAGGARIFPVFLAFMFVISLIPPRLPRKAGTQLHVRANLEEQVRIKSVITNILC